MFTDPQHWLLRYDTLTHGLPWSVENLWCHVLHGPAEGVAQLLATALLHTPEVRELDMPLPGKQKHSYYSYWHSYGAGSRRICINFLKANPHQKPADMVPDPRPGYDLLWHKNLNNWSNSNIKVKVVQFVVERIRRLSPSFLREKLINAKFSYSPILYSKMSVILDTTVKIKRKNWDANLAHTNIDNPEPLTNPQSLSPLDATQLLGCKNSKKREAAINQLFSPVKINDYRTGNYY